MKSARNELSFDLTQVRVFSHSAPEASRSFLKNNGTAPLEIQIERTPLLMTRTARVPTPSTSHLRLHLMTFFTVGVVYLCALAALSPEGRASVSAYPHFVEPGRFAIGVEPELTFSEGGGASLTARYSQGLTELNHLAVMIGTGDGPQQFRVGSGLSFDFFPDQNQQPGVGVAVQGMLIQVPTPGRAEESSSRSARGEFLAIPYVHKTVPTGKYEMEPYFSMPIGFSVLEGKAQLQSSIVLGSYFRILESLRSSFELGVAINHANSYFSGGLTYYH